MAGGPAMQVRGLCPRCAQPGGCQDPAGIQQRSPVLPPAQAFAKESAA